MNANTVSQIKHYQAKYKIPCKGSKFVLTKPFLNMIYDEILNRKNGKRKKEIGGVLDYEASIINNKHYILERYTVNRGQDYSVSYSAESSDYEVMYHTHEYKPNKKKMTPKEKLESFSGLCQKNRLMQALYFFENNIVEIHPPSPQDIISCIHNTLTLKKCASLVFTFEGIYIINCTSYWWNRVYNRKQLNEFKEKLSCRYFKSIWGVSEKTSSSILQTRDCKSIKGLIQKVQKHTQKYTKRQRISQYIKFVQELCHVRIRFLPQNMYKTPQKIIYSVK